MSKITYKLTIDGEFKGEYGGDGKEEIFSSEARAVEGAIKLCAKKREPVYIQRWVDMELDESYENVVMLAKTVK